MNADYYEILGIDKSATKDEIKKAYRTLSKKYHPDVNDAANAAVFFRMVEEAYQALYNEDARQAYNDQQSQQVYDYEYEDFSSYSKSSHHEYAGSESDTDSTPPKRQRGRLGSILHILLKVILFPIFVLLAFLSKVIFLLGGLFAMAGWLVFGLGVLMCVMFLFSQAGWQEIAAGVLVAFLGFLAANLSSVIIAGVDSLKDAVGGFIFS